MGVYPPHGTVAGGFPIPGDAATAGAAATEEVGWDMRVHLGIGSKIGGMVLADRDLHLKKDGCDEGI